MLSLQGIASPSLPNHGRAGLVPIRGHVGTPVGSCEPGGLDGGRACVLSCA
jgi:hypothetical protein